MAAKAYTLLVGLLLLVVGILGLLGRVPLSMDHNWLHTVSGVTALLVAAAAMKHARRFAQVFGSIYVLLVLLGIVGLSSVGPLHLMLNSRPVLYVHGAVGLAGLMAGFLGRKTAEPAQQMKAAA